MHVIKHVLNVRVTEGPPGSLGVVGGMGCGGGGAGCQGEDWWAGPAQPLVLVTQ